jgi:hypothetical protein
MMVDKNIAPFKVVDSYQLVKFLFLDGTVRFDIENKNLVYANMKPTHHGLQCNLTDENPNYSEIMEMCNEITELIKKIDKLNNHG